MATRTLALAVCGLILCPVAGAAASTTPMPTTSAGRAAAPAAGRDGGVVGVHGTDQPELIPGRPSHGCVRLRNGDVARLWRLVAIGTPVAMV